MRTKKAVKQTGSLKNLKLSRHIIQESLEKGIIFERLNVKWASNRRLFSLINLQSLPQAFSSKFFVLVSFFLYFFSYKLEFNCIFFLFLSFFSYPQYHRKIVAIYLNLLRIILTIPENIIKLNVKIFRIKMKIVRNVQN